MEIDGEMPRPARGQTAVHPLKDDLSLLSEDELAERITLLSAEIERCRAMLDGKAGARQQAEAVFGGR